MVITKFNGTHLDLIRFWNQFQAEIGSNATISNLKIFSYLTELTVSSVHASIERIPFTTEGYQRTKSILQTKYGKTSEIMTSNVQRIMQLPVVFGKNPLKVHEFYEKLVTHVQALE